MYSSFSLIFCFHSEEFVSSDNSLSQTLDPPVRRNILYHTPRAKTVLQLIIIELELRAEDFRVKEFRACMYCMYGIKFMVKNTVLNFIIIYVFLKALERPPPSATTKRYSSTELTRW